MDILDWIEHEITPRLSPEQVFEGVDLRSHGASLRGRCPLHGGTNPTSFTVKRETLQYHCFSCDARGNALTYLYETRGFGFPEALEFLANSAGVDSPEQSPRDPAQVVLRTFVETARALLHGDLGKPARSYLLDTRRFPAGSLHKLDIGWIPSLPPLVRQLRGTGCDMRLAKQLGVLHPAWEGRVIGPWRGLGGQIGTIWGRSLTDGDTKYFYLPGQRRSHLLPYGVNRANRRSRDARRLVLVEGFMDVLHLQAIGFHNAAAIGGSGSSLGATGWKSLVAAGHPEVVLALDADESGVSGTRAALENLLESAAVADVHVLKGTALQGANDIDEWLRRGHSRQQFVDLLAGPDCVPDTCFLVENCFASDIEPVGASRRIAMTTEAIKTLYRYRELACSLETREAFGVLERCSGYDRATLREKAGAVAAEKGWEPIGPFTYLASSQINAIEDVIVEVVGFWPGELTKTGVCNRLSGRETPQGPSEPGSEFYGHLSEMHVLEIRQACDRLLESSELIYLDGGDRNRKLTLPGMKPSWGKDCYASLRERETPGYVIRARERSPRAYFTWEREEDEALSRMHERGNSRAEIARALKRQTSAIRARLRKLGLEH